MSILILGSSVRAAAFSARRAGLSPIGIDLFADRDLTAIAHAIAISPAEYPHGLISLAGTAPSAPWIYTGALENHPEIIDQAARDRPLWGNDGATLRAVRDPMAVADVLRVTGLPCPDVRLSPEGLPSDGSWLVKPFRSAGGEGIRPLGPNDLASRRASYYQERISGPSVSAIFVGGRTGASLAGITGQWIGRPGSEFGYVGSVGPWPVSDREAKRIGVLGDTVARAFGLVGLFGIDLILRDGLPWPVEINPRYTASVEILELALGRSLLAEHRRACESTDPRLGMPPVPPSPRTDLVVGKVILFATERFRFPDLDLGPVATADPFEVPRFGDIPRSGTVIEAGWPVITLFARGSDPATCRLRLEARRAFWERKLRQLL